MRPGSLGAALLAAAALLALGHPADAQRAPGQGKGRDRQPQQSPQPESQADPAPGTYPVSGQEALEAVNRGEGREALAYYERAAAEAEQAGDRLRAARVLHVVGAVSVRLGRYQKTIQSATRAVEIFRATGELSQQDASAWVDSCVQLGTAYRLTGDHVRSEKALEEALAVTRSKMSGRREAETEGLLLVELANLAFAKRDYPAALARSTQAAQYFEGAEGRLPANASERQRSHARRWAAGAFTGIGRAQLAQGKPDEAEAAYAKALTYARLSESPVAQLQALMGQGGLAQSRGEWEKSLAIYRECEPIVAVTRQAGVLLDMQQRRARALAALGRTEEALAASRGAVAAVEELRAGLDDSALRSGFFENKQGVYQQAVFLALEAGHPDEAFSLAERSRSRTFLDLLGSQTTLSKGRTRSLVEEEVRLRARLAEAQARARGQEPGAPESERARAAAEALDRDYKDFLERVRKENLEQASLMSVEPVSVPEVQKLLPEGATLLEYLLADKELVIWVVDRRAAKVVRVPVDREALVKDVRDFRGAIAGRAKLAKVQEQAAALGQVLVAPVRAGIRGKRLVVVPHGVLHYLPFAALRGANKRWLVEDFSLSTLPSASVLRYLKDKGADAPARTLVVGNPDLGPDLALPWADREARMVGQREPGATVLLRAEATEASVKKNLGNAGLVHFAVHGDLRQADPLSSALLFVPGGGEDGRLEVRELFGLDLRARLVVLSACETGLGRISRGDEVVGLQRAFLYAGAPAVVTTLWKIEDRASYELVRAFYDRLDQAGAAEALREAQIATRKAFPHPYSWAAFVLTGAPR